MNGRRTTQPRRPAVLRLLQAERSEEIFPLLLEEVIALGNPRALVVDVNLDSGEVTPAAALKWPRVQMENFTSALWMQEHPLTGILHNARPEVLAKSSLYHRPLYVHPILYSNRNLCWEADRIRTASCLAVQNFRHEKRIRLEDQVCSTCEMRAYAAAVVVELPKSYTAQHVAELGDLIDLANRYLSRLFKVEHYYNRMRDMEITIAQMGTVMQSMADPVILTDTQHRVIMQNKAAERFFRVPEEMTEGLVRAVEFNNLLFSAALSSMLVSGSDSHRDLTLVDAIEGEEMLFEAVSAPTYGPDAIQLGTVTVMRDVTDLRRADLELRLNYERLSDAEEVVRQDRDRLNLIIENVGAETASKSISSPSIASTSVRSRCESLPETSMDESAAEKSRLLNSTARTRPSVISSGTRKKRSAALFCMITRCCVSVRITGSAMLCMTVPICAMVISISRMRL